MKRKILVALPLAAILMATAAAQQTPSSQSDQTSKDQASMATGKEPLTEETRQGFWGKVNPFARKKYVQRQVQPVRDRVNELDELTAANSRKISDVDARAQQGIQLASNRVNEADTHAVDAGNRATMAHQTAQQASERLGTVEHVVGNIDQYQPSSQIEIRFNSGQTALSKKAKDAIDEMAGNLKAQKGYVVEVQGFAPGRGSEGVRSSQSMAAAVVRYLVMNHEIPVYRIYTVGMGNAPVPASTEGGKAQRTRGGRVEISLLKNGVEELGQTVAGGSAGTSPMQ